MKEEERGTAVGLQVSGDWRKRHEGRMQTVGVVRGVEKKESTRVETERPVVSPVPSQSSGEKKETGMGMGMGLGDGWGW